MQQIVGEEVLIEQRRQQLEMRRKEYTWKFSPEFGLPSHFDDANSLPLDEEFHRAKAVNFLSNSFQGIFFNGMVVTAAIKAVDDIIQKALGISTSSFESVSNLYIFEQLPMRLLSRQMENRGKEPKVVIKEDGPNMPICQAHKWITDEEFGWQILNGVNPVVICRCTGLPDNFPVTNDMVKNSLVRGLTLEQEIEVRQLKIYVH